jgi:hypothetical protein
MTTGDDIASRRYHSPYFCATHILRDMAHHLWRITYKVST